ncbi:hypothetical protein QE152_g7547 [Popillia japonica]|uniref:Uncharacterized protein n=1 Tax=Popillia japonica TaxID=7064 RepID=A0AAW1MEQ2_POPJA
MIQRYRSHRVTDPGSSVFLTGVIVKEDHAISKHPRTFVLYGCTQTSQSFAVPNNIDVNMRVFKFKCTEQH